MAKVFIEESTLTTIADAIREKEGSTDLVPVNDMASRISAIPNGVLGIEIEITSNISNAFELAQILFKNSTEQNHTYCATLKKTKNDTIVNNQFLLITKIRGIHNGYRYRNGEYLYVTVTTSYEARVTIGDIYEVFDLGEMQYGN